MARLYTLVSVLASLGSALPNAGIKREASELSKTYDFIIAGGGTCGLTLADRLTQAFPNKTVLVVEYGQIEYAPGSFDPPQTVWGSGNPNQASTWRFNSLPNAEVDNKTASVAAGKVVGGSSAVNGMFFDRGSRHDYDAWDKVGSPEFDSATTKWNWREIFPYFRKSVTFTEPSEAAVQKYNYTWNMSSFGGSTPIYSSLPPFQWGDHGIVRNAWKEMGIPVLKECAGGDKAGLCWIPISQHPVTARRSHSGLGHYAAVNETRPNYHLLTKHQVVRITYPQGLDRGPPVVEVRSLADDTLFNVTAKSEVILAAGALFTPTILHRSGIGPASTLREAGIPLVLNLPGVGNNLQDHMGPALLWNYSKPLDLPDLSENMAISSYAADALAGFDETPARGPYTLAMSNSALYLSLPFMDPNYTSIITKIRNMVADGSAAQYLPPSYRSDPEMIAGYNKQLLVTADFLANPTAPSTEVPWATGTSFRIFILHPLSRGTVRLNGTHPLEQPVLDYRGATNPVDFDIHMAHVRYVRAMFATPTMQGYSAVEVGPGASVARDGAALKQYIKDQMTLSFLHPCCTAAMLPKKKGGVVGPDLKVHGAAGLRIVDMSVLPFLPSSHLSATAYAMGEKAADMIIKEFAGKE